jgi:hypothetical protein
MAAPSDILVGKADTLDLPSTQNSSDEWMKSFALERHFLLTLCCCWQKVSRTARKLCEKSHAWQCPEGYDMGSIPSQSLFFARTKQSNQKKVRPYYCSKEPIKSQKSTVVFIRSRHNKT